MAAALPKSEALRLNVLRSYSILDTLAEQAYDDLTLLASQICDTPIALISLVDHDRQWFKSKVGIETDETPRDQSFCAHAILEPEHVFVVNDASSDPRFHDNPLVTSAPHIRFYAGAPLVSPAGEAIGTLCVIDDHQRGLSERQQQCLQALARQVMAQFELRRLVRELETLSTTDGLTGIRNRRAFDEKLVEEHQRSVRTRSPFSMLLLDVDHFKSYNDEFGHQAGDAVLEDVARILQYTVRNYDMAARYGGEEFGVVLPNTEKSGALELAERLRKEIERAEWIHRRITVSIGVATLRFGQSVPALIEEADKALYTAKESGRNKIAHSEAD
jgi:diguanylate cyclase (GGDEF)-like protein